MKPTLALSAVVLYAAAAFAAPTERYIIGVAAAADPVAVAAAAPGGGAPAAEAAEEQSEFDVILESAGDKKIGVIKVVREIVSGLGLKEAKDLVDGAPKPVLEKAPKEAAEEAKTKLEAAGATVTVK